MAAAIAYLEEQKTALDGAETIPMDIDWATAELFAYTQTAHILSTESSHI